MKPLKIYTFKELYLKEFPEKKYYLNPLLFQGSLMMLYASPGIGKTFAALGMAIAAASKGTFLKWRSEHECRVLYVDGEMGDEAIKDRLEKQLMSIDFAYKNENIKIISPDEINGGEIPQISDVATHNYYLEICKDRDLIIFDNYGCLTSRQSRDSDDDVWERSWKLLKKLRAQGKAIIIVHHAGKAGAQLGTSKKEQPLNWMIELKRPAIYEPHQGARFELKFTKVRGVHGNDVENLIVDIYERDNGINWEWKGLENEIEQRIHKMKEVGMTDRQIAEEIGRPLFLVKSVLKKGATEIDIKDIGSSNYYDETEKELF